MYVFAELYYRTGLNLHRATLRRIRNGLGAAIGAALDDGGPLAIYPYPLVTDVRLQRVRAHDLPRVSRGAGLPPTLEQPDLIITIRKPGISDARFMNEIKLWLNRTLASSKDHPQVVVVVEGVDRRTGILPRFPDQASAHA